MAFRKFQVGGVISDFYSDKLLHVVVNYILGVNVHQPFSLTLCGDFDLAQRQTFLDQTA